MMINPNRTCLPARVASLLCTIFVLAHAVAVNASTPDADALSEKMLNAIGGRANWARVKNTVHDAQQFRAEAPLEVRGVISMDFERPRFRIDTTAPDFKVVRVIDGERDWRLTRDGKVVEVPAATRAEDLRWYAAHVYRTIARVAKREPAISVSVATDGRLQVLEAGKRIAWYRLNAAGEPYAYGAHDDEKGALCGPWTYQKDGIHHPVWTSSADGAFRAAINSLQVNAAFTDTMFERQGGAKPD